MFFVLRISLILSFGVFGFKAFSACAAGSGDDCPDQFIVPLDEAFGEVYCNCLTNYGMITKPTKTQAEQTRGYLAECARLTGDTWNDSTGYFNEETGAGLSFDNCQEGLCRCLKVYQIRVPLYEKIKSVNSSSTARIFQKLVTIADETCQAVSAVESKKYKLAQCIYSDGLEGPDTLRCSNIDQSSGKCVE